jgi:hypothetical protein
MKTCKSIWRDSCVGVHLQWLQQTCHWNATYLKLWRSSVLSWSFTKTERFVSGLELWAWADAGWIRQLCWLRIWQVAQYRAITYSAAGKTDYSTITGLSALKSTLRHGVCQQQVFCRMKQVPGAGSFLDSQYFRNESRNSPYFVEPQGSLPFSQQTSIWQYSKANWSSTVF